MSAFHFLRPWWGLSALLWLPLVYVLWREARQGTTWRRLVDASLLPHLLSGSPTSRRGPAGIMLLAGILASLALAGPTWQRLPQPLYANGAAQVVAVSLSRRMLARDVTPDRMARVRYKVHDLLHANAGGRNGLVAYAGAAFTVAPPTTDAHALDDLLDALSPDVMPVHGDAPARAIRRGVRLLGTTGGSLVLVTDRVNQAAIDAARKARTQGVQVSVLGVGGSHGVPVTLPDGSVLHDADGHVVMARQDAHGLQAMANAGGGIYVPMRDDNSDIAALKSRLHVAQHPHSAAAGQGDQWRDMGPWLLLPLLLLAALGFRKGWLLVLPWVLLPCWLPAARAADTAPASAATTARAGSTIGHGTRTPGHDGWSRWWFNADQRAARALANGNPERAQQLARSPAWQGAAGYRAGHYAEAAKAFARAPGANAAYNMGNALAKAGQYRKAIQAYDKALRLDPKLADARANRKAVKHWLAQHRNRAGRKNGKSGSGAGNHGKQSPSSAQSQSGQSPGKKSSSRTDGHAANPGHSPASAASSASKGAHDSRSPQPARAGSSPPASASTAPSPAPVATRMGPARPASTPARPQAPSAPDAKTARAQQAEARAAGKALQRQLGDAGKSRPVRQPDSFDLGRVPASATSAQSLPESMRRALQRIPDDPGGLLKRKFELEYQERRNSGHGGGS